MAITDKQERNGVPGPAETQDSGRSGPDVTGAVASLQGQAENIGNAGMSEGHALLGGTAGHTVSYEWDAGLAIGEMPGEA